MPEQTDPQQRRTEAEAARIRAALERVVEAACLRQSPRQQRLLRHIVEASLDGGDAQLDGYTLGIEVFDRGVEFDPLVDPIVRVELVRLRSKLIEHYAGEGADDPVRIDIPKGGYAARFVFRAEREAGAASPSHPATDDKPGRGETASRVEGLVPSRDPLFGRDKDIAALERLIAAHRSVTVLGAGGIGKTRLVQALALVWIERRGERAAWVDLTRIADPALLPTTLAQTLGLPIAQGDDPLAGLLAALRPVVALMVLDNAEHLADAVAHLARATLDAAPGLRILVTSQVPLHLSDERLFRLDVLELPPADASPAQARQAAAVALFVDRVRAFDHRFEPADDQIMVIAQLTRRLDGLPLAIRLAAARVPQLGLSGLETRLHERFRLLTSNERDAPTRQQTMLAALEWSYGLLGADEQRLFRRVAVFVGGFTTDLAVDACSDEPDDPWTVIDGLGRLVDRSLISLEPGDPPRYRVHDGPREYALRLLAANEGELEQAQQRHARAIAETMSAAFDSFLASSESEWVPRWAPELDNLRAALDCSACRDPETHVSLVGSASLLFWFLDVGPEMRRRAARLDPERVAATAPSHQFLYWLGRGYVEWPDRRQSYACTVEAERLARIIGDSQRLYVALCLRAATALVPAGERETLHAEIAALESGSWSPIIRAFRRIAEFALFASAGRWADSLGAAEAGFALASEGGSVMFKALLAYDIMLALMGQQRIEAALERSRTLRPMIASAPATAIIPFIGACARCEFLHGDIENTRRQLAALLDLCRSADWAYANSSSHLFVSLALAESRTETAARLLGYAEEVARGTWRGARAAIDEARTRLETTMEPRLLARLCAEGAKLDPEEICALVLGSD